MFSKALLIMNGKAGQADKRKQLEAITGILAECIIELTLIQTQQQGEAERICRDRAESYDLVLILGGDGTVHECINGLASLNQPPLIGILPGGTCNDFSRALGIPQQLTKAAELIQEGRSMKVDIGQMNDRYFSNFFGIGLITEASENINQQTKDLFGKISYYISVLQTLPESQSFSFELETDSETIKDEALMILVANGTFIGTNQLPLPESSLNDGLLDVIIIQETGLPLLREFLSAKGAEVLEPNPDVWQYRQTSRVRLQTDRKMKADTDGETYMETPVNIRLFSQQLSFIVGSES
ncbi:diacylglycerol/lipid kinase family protein [Bacillus horti]|uniref:YegS/Rv2252/BmrU family lipid kinase n=1 Tax=Caldalkalibacillus horti TaxID=77523 RepID=A0ABT9VVK2_9BACI|nr:YegS/Rv2252/BmrU family lipid kinase [Bacillus horti]MDQ0165024.1 YegS/Rv2252/BmrU family lipid kinase [Bacillus horti]